jgi:hypothetical protein
VVYPPIAKRAHAVREDGVGADSEGR